MTVSQPKQRQRQRKADRQSDADSFQDSAFDEWREVAPDELFPPDSTVPINPFNEKQPR